MNLANLFEMQRELDAFIEENRGVKGNVFLEKGLALLVELSELANETRCFKFWSTKGSSEREVILEEYVDSIHFILSLGIEKGYDDLKTWPTDEVEGDLTKLFLLANKDILNFLQSPDKEDYEKIWISYDAIAQALGFTNEEIIQAYLSKNEKNYERQKNGY